ncbi:MAG: hypothetical protein ACE5GV_05940 [Candidatus Scalindua sp.]
MGLDATVYCNCYEKGDLKTLPHPEWRLKRDTDGSLICINDNIDIDLEVDQWILNNMCKHENGEALSHYIGNISMVGHIRSILEPHQNNIPIIFQQIIYSGSHCGDFIPYSEIPSLVSEINFISKLSYSDKDDNQIHKQFVEQLQNLVDACNEFDNPIAF